MSNMVPDKPNERFGITIKEPFVEPLLKCPNCGDSHYTYCRVRTKGKIHFCFNCKKEFIPIQDDNQQPLPPELNNMEIVMQDDMKLPTSDSV